MLLDKLARGRPIDPIDAGTDRFNLGVGDETEREERRIDVEADEVERDNPGLPSPIEYPLDPFDASDLWLE